MSAIILLALVSTGVTTEVSTFTVVESVAVVESVFESLQAAKIEASANAKNTFFILNVLVLNILFAFDTTFKKR